MQRWHMVLAGGMLLVAGGVIGTSCDSSSGGGGPGAMFCRDWAAGFCHKLYACDSADQRGPFGGSSEVQCTQAWTAACAEPPPAGQTFDVNCSGAAHVDGAAQGACLNELSTISCDDFNSPSYVSACTQVCSAADGGGGAGGTAGTGGGAGMAAGGNGGTGTDGAGNSCGRVGSCDGSLVGDWSFTSECVDNVFSTSAVQLGFACPTAQATSTQATISGTATFGADLTYVIAQNVTGTIGLTVPANCTGGLSCMEYAAYETSLMPKSTIACQGASACACTDATTNVTNDSGTYTTSGTTLSIASATRGPGAMQYCVQGSTLHLLVIDQATSAGGHPVILRDIVAQRQ